MVLLVSKYCKKISYLLFFDNMFESTNPNSNFGLLFYFKLDFTLDSTFLPRLKSKFNFQKLYCLYSSFLFQKHKVTNCLVAYLFGNLILLQRLDNLSVVELFHLFKYCVNSVICKNLYPSIDTYLCKDEMLFCILDSLVDFIVTV